MQQGISSNIKMSTICELRVKKDGKEDEKATEQKFRWDEECHLLAANENGFVSCYWYDADGEQLQAIKDNYRTFDIAYNVEDNDDYVNGRSFCCNDSLLEAAQAKAMTRSAIDGNFKPNDDYEKMLFYYHPDHLDSSSYITILDGEVSQHIEYVPFGEVFIEERNNTWNTLYSFNAKEFDEETGMYYYGARYYEPRLSLWMSTDPLQEKYPNISSYCYTINNPIRYIDIKGTEVGDPPGPGYYRARINSRYIGFGLRNPLAAIKIGFGVSKGSTDISTNATRFATRGEILYGSTRQQEDRCSENGAFRHTLWQATITPKFGSRVALEAGNAHEKDPFTYLSVRTFSSLDDADQTVDLLNNQIGRRIGSLNKNVNMKDLALQVLEEFKNNGLYTATKKKIRCGL